MPIDLFIETSVDELRVLLKRLEGALISGQITSTSASGVSTSRQIKSTADIRRQILAVRYSLFCKLPDFYENPYKDRVTRTSANYIT